MFRNIKRNEAHEDENITVLAPETSAIFDEETEKVTGAAPIKVPETQTQHPGSKFQSQVYGSEIENAIKKQKVQERLRLTFKNLHADLSMKKEEASIGHTTDQIMDNTNAESPSILSFKNKQHHSRLEFTHKDSQNTEHSETLVVNAEIHAFPSNLSSTESPSILSGNKVTKNINMVDSHNIADNETLSIFELQNSTMLPSKRTLIEPLFQDTSLDKVVVQTNRTTEQECSNNVACKESTTQFNKKAESSDRDDLINENLNGPNKSSTRGELIHNQMRTTNKWGIEISSDFSSAVNRSGSLKQGSIHTFLRPKSELVGSGRKIRKRRKEDVLDEDIRTAIELSKLEAEQSNSGSYMEHSIVDVDERFMHELDHEYDEHNLKYPANILNMNKGEDRVQEDSPKRAPLLDIIDSFNCVPDTMMLNGKQNLGGPQPKFKFLASPVRKKADRNKFLQGHDCKDCREFYKGDNISESQLADLLNKCSKHRSKCPPPQQSPQIRWHLELEEDGPNDKTQIPSPLKTRERRKLLKKL